MLLDLFLLNVFIMLCSWVLVTYNRRAGLVDVAWSFRSLVCPPMKDDHLMAALDESSNQMNTRRPCSTDYQSACQRFDPSSRRS